MTSARYGVDPAELLSAAGAAAEVADGLRAARSALLASDGAGRWAHDLKLAAVAGRAIDALVAAAEIAVARAVVLEESLRVASEGYARSDAQWVR